MNDYKAAIIKSSIIESLINLSIVWYKTCQWAIKKKKNPNIVLPTNLFNIYAAS